MAKPAKPKRVVAKTFEIWAEIQSSRRSYFISRKQRDEGASDDEAILSIQACIIEPPPSFRDCLGQSLDVSVISACRYGQNQDEPARFFGTVNLQSKSRSALAYLPPAPFWAMPKMIDEGSRLLNLSFVQLRGRMGYLTGLYLCDAEDRAELLEFQTRN
ncbi:hypothetical protein [Sphingomonas jaspsi]|uniref:hypothetical protein n=1 Tax=Sphingomonas jaspsi TaxID=392409 RepID=UPI00056A3EF6|nr:hypothetical protein [Sphingomonas jaspsi]